jgi:hypothetical protein
LWPSNELGGCSQNISYKRILKSILQTIVALLGTVLGRVVFA